MLRPFLPCLALAAILLPVGAGAECRIGLYGDPDGLTQEINFGDGRLAEFSIYVLMHVEDVVDAVAYDLVVPGLGTDIFSTGDNEFGPADAGLQFETSGGESVGLGDCYPGFGGQALLVARYGMIMPIFRDGVIRLEPNGDPGNDPAAATYSNCQGDLVPCPIEQDLSLYGVATEALSFGRVKALYRN